MYRASSLVDIPADAVIGVVAGAMDHGLDIPYPVLTGQLKARARSAAGAGFI